MQSSNPVLGRAFPKKGYAAQPPLFGSRTDDALEDIYNAPSASPLQTGRMTIEDVVAKTGFLFGILLQKNILSGNSSILKVGVKIFILGYMATEILLFFQGGLLYFGRGMISGYYESIFVFSLLLVLGLILIMASKIKDYS